MVWARLTCPEQSCPSEENHGSISFGCDPYVREDASDHGGKGC